MGLPDDGVLMRLVDVHCHAGEYDNISQADMDDLKITICAMASNCADQVRVRVLAERWPNKVIPAFGYHPWWAHHVSLVDPPPSRGEHYRSLFLPLFVSSTAPTDLEAAFTRLLPSLPDPRPLSDVLAELRSNLSAHPRAMLGEVGLDHSARVPFSPADTDGRKQLSPFSTPLAHQRALLEAQLELAVEMQRNVSMHSVKAPLPTRAVLDAMARKHGTRWRAISVDLHSCGVSPQMWTEIEKHHPNAFLSLSKAINSRSPNHRALIKACDPHRLLVESDYPLVSEVTGETWWMVETIAEMRGWRVERSTGDFVAGEDVEQWGVVQRLEENWKRFVKGGHTAKKVMNRKRRTDYSYQEYPDSHGSDQDA
ncbi:hypothetical protein K488DRAFT_77557 [Vararia minispora EC-137]|uniref:Uncharacterized protein n=1 Tax=Vararia minispora EC-137 TaxID=1314806 RepID=A0ACB8QQ32_9AGAM|nr:hypothetical protein K488DRAFT_77557 [Vararia minispora EC-137]